MDRRIAGRRYSRCDPSRRRLPGTGGRRRPGDRDGLRPGRLRPGCPLRGAGQGDADFRGIAPADAATQGPGGSHRLGAPDLGDRPSHGLATLARSGHPDLLPGDGRRVVSTPPARRPSVDLPDRRRRVAESLASDDPRRAPAAARAPGHRHGGDPRAPGPRDGRPLARALRPGHGARRRADAVPAVRHRGQDRGNTLVRRTAGRRRRRRRSSRPPA